MCVQILGSERLTLLEVRTMEQLMQDPVAQIEPKDINSLAQKMSLAIPCADGAGVGRFEGSICGIRAEHDHVPVRTRIGESTQSSCACRIRSANRDLSIPVLRIAEFARSYRSSKVFISAVDDEVVTAGASCLLKPCLTTFSSGLLRKITKLPTLCERQGRLVVLIRSAQHVLE